MTVPLRSCLVLAFAVVAGCQCRDNRLNKSAEPEPGPKCVEPVAEVCDGRDNDCDGEVDEGLPEVRCGVGACAHSQPTCVAGATVECAPLPPSAEVCDGQDNDCDGLSDEDLLPAQCGVGECAAVAPSCRAGAPVTCMPSAPGVESCDGKDNDCDGTVDEDLLANISNDRRLTNDVSSSDYVYIHWNGERFGVVWQDKRNGTDGDIFFAGLTKSGARLLPNDVRVTQTSGATGRPALAWTGSQYVLVYVDATEGNPELYSQAVGVDGARIGPARRLTNAANASDWPDVAFNGTELGVVWQDSRSGAEDVYFLRLSPEGAPLAPEVQVTNHPARQSSPILKWSGSEFGVVWPDTRHGTREIYFRRLSAKGELVGDELRVTNDAGESSWPDLAWGGGQWATAWQDDRDGNKEIYLARISADGVKLGGDVRITQDPASSSNPSIDWNGFQYGLSWQDERSGGKPAIYFASVSSGGVKNGADLKVSRGSGRSEFTTALWNGSQFAFCWRDDRDGPASNTEIYFAYVGCPGTLP